MLCLGIETSCDETSASVVEDGREIRSNIISSQVEIHSKYGGVVPELASRHHVEQVTQVVDAALMDAGVSLQQIDLIGATCGPGLIGALLVGLSYAKALAFAGGIPFVGVHHIEGHIHAVTLEREVPTPYLCLVVSGGHTALIHVRAFGEYRVLGKTRDDAVGEAYDKVAKMMGLGYPGGPVIDRLAHQGNPCFVRFPRSMLKNDSLDFSFSGLKTAVLNFLLRNGWGPEGEGAEGLREHLSDVAASFQEAVMEVLITKTMTALHREGLARVTLGGGVAANGMLRRRLAQAAEKEGAVCSLPSSILCTDNAAMIAAVASRYHARGIVDDLSLNASAALRLGHHFSRANRDREKKEEDSSS
ncbi:MAG: tRNA (adenosine(37)-N6)-threonylcarbamoyltransferase complex transferase subunit TsaD [Deltaproteobacteria bacterium]|nr:tRNA (adenosine(37)-N6)-threonylcarbamoyltransferase complex transferase subunit TsaD [Deltaproteobacteria bacterium]